MSNEGLTQAEAAERLNMSSPTHSNNYIVVKELVEKELPAAYLAGAAAAERKRNYANIIPGPVATFNFLSGAMAGGFIVFLFHVWKCW